MADAPTTRLEWVEYPPAVQHLRAAEFAALMARRRSVRHFSSRPVPTEVLEEVIRTASSAPSGANKQPWKFVLVEDPVLKGEIRRAAEEEERRNYGGRMPAEWREELVPFGTDWQKEFLEVAPALIVVMKERYRVTAGRQSKLYYVDESVGIACGFLIAAIHYAGLVCLTHTPSPMNFLSGILRRPPEETPFLLIPVGYPAADAMVPRITRKPLDEILIRVPDSPGVQQK